MAFRRLHSGQGTPHIDGKTRAWVGELDLSEGSATLNYDDSLPGMRGSFSESPTIIVTGPDGGEAVTSRGTTQATISGSGDDTVQVLVYENRADLSDE